MTDDDHTESKMSLMTASFSYRSHRGDFDLSLNNGQARFTGPAPFWPFVTATVLTVGMRYLSKEAVTWTESVLARRLIRASPALFVSYCTWEWARHVVRVTPFKMEHQ